MRTSLGFGWWDILCLAGVAQGLFLAAVLWTQGRGDRRANRLLASLLGLYSLHLLHIVLYWTRSIEVVPHFWGAVLLFPYLYGVLLFLYARRLFDPGSELRGRDAVHFAPFVLFTAFFGRFYLLPADVKLRMLEASYGAAAERPGAVLLTIWGLQFVHFVLYFAAARRRLTDVPGESRSGWLRRLSTAFAISFACWFLYGIGVAAGLPYSRAIDYGATLAMTVSIFAVGATALRAPEIFLGELGRRRGKYEGSPLTDGQLDAYRARVEGVMDAERPYIDANLRLTDLATLVEVPPHQLSQVLNQGFGLRFNDFVNRYRVEEAKRLMSDPTRREESILELAFEAGFNNKTSFNQAFKKYTRTTPSRYREAILRQAL